MEDWRDAYIKKLERRIHNQRVALRYNWEIVEMRMKARKHYRYNDLLRRAVRYSTALREMREIIGAALKENPNG